MCSHLSPSPAPISIASLEIHASKTFLARLHFRSNVVLCGGTENMSQAPMWIDGLTARWGAQVIGICILFYNALHHSRI